MKKLATILSVILLLATVACMFLPIATFEDNTIFAILEDIEKQEGRVESAQAKYDRDFANPKKTQKDHDKNQAKIDKETEKLNELLAEKAASDSAKEAARALRPSSDPRQVMERLAETTDAKLMVEQKGSTSFSGLKKSGIRPMIHGFIISALVVVVALAVEMCMGIV